MKITVCELSNRADKLEQEWQKLAEHVKSEDSDLVLLPEMPFYPWIAQTNKVQRTVWEKSVEVHERWLTRFTELGDLAVASSRPVINSGKHLNEGFIWDNENGYTAVHHKYYLPNEEGWWEASWYERGKNDFTITQTNKSKIGFLICTELWFGVHAREYSTQGIELLVCPRVTGMASREKWVAGGRTAAVVSGAYCLSSNFSHSEGDEMKWAGTGWIIEPEEGDVLGVTSANQPFLTMEIDLSLAEAAKNTYPRYVVG